MKKHVTLHKKMKFSIKDFFSKCVTFTEEFLYGKLHLLCSVMLIRRLRNCLLWVHLVFHQGDIVKKMTSKVERASEKDKKRQFVI